MVTVDEAHCISQWGQDFRPSYLGITQFVAALPTRPVVSAFTATATEKVKEDILDKLCLQEPFQITTGFDRENLYFEVRRPGDKNRELLGILKEKGENSGIIYCSTRNNVESVCELLCDNGYLATRYHAGLPDEERKQNQEDFLHDRKRVMVATNAFGMGIDKSNVSHVIHYNMPKNIESYYQEAGRAGRDGSDAECILLYSAKDVRTNRFLIEKSAENSAETASPQDAALRIQKDMELLKKMTWYATTTDCLRGYILRYFGESAPIYCGKCGNCDTQFESRDVTDIVRGIAACLEELAAAGRFFGKKMVCDMLLGAKNEKIENWHLDRFASYGTLENTTAAMVRDVLEMMVQKDCVAQSGGQYPTISLSENYAVLMAREVKIEMQLPKQKEPSKRKTANATDNALFSKLKALRHSLAEEAHVPAYVIFSDVSLLEMCKILPTEQYMLLRVSGVGKVKLERYGDAFLRVIREHVLAD